MDGDSIIVSVFSMSVTHALFVTSITEWTREGFIMSADITEMSDNLLRIRTVYRDRGEMVAWDRIPDFDINWYLGLGHVILVEKVRLTANSYEVIETLFDDNNS
jgi:hypothetical protein